VRILALTATRYLRATLEVVGDEAEFLVAPPLGAAEIKAPLLEGYDVLYIDLHGIPSNRYLWADPEQIWPALGLDAVREADLQGVTVVATTCWLDETPFPEAFGQSGAQVVGGGGPNVGSQGGRGMLIGAQLLARELLVGLRAGEDVAAALDGARRVLARSVWRLINRRAVDDALAFRVLTGGSGETQSHG
jgi:hypothetical protein